ncbi:cytochrome P450 [Suillus paluster]|uniref:cytochrome P450 n=1 Tax=Suillus paluster TaxID=48578 RepID=UPI001B878B17|nr:cytochrome P450 [Suillus paluster]KAG1738595.1 cytochrome P450 [Suillus paluster]
MASFIRQFTSSVAPMPSSTSLVDIPIPSFIISSTKSATWFYTTAAVLGGLLVLEQSVYRYKKKHLPGAAWTIPIIGKFADSMKPTMEGYMNQWNSGALSAVSVFNIFIVMASSNEYARKIMNSPGHAEPCLVHSAKQILMPDNWVFLTGKSHVEYRKVLNTLFTRKALSIYIGIQDAIARQHFAQWLVDAKKDPSPQSIMMTARNLNMLTSLRVFCGNHIPEQGAVDISEKYWDITQALELVNFPLAFPGTKVYRAIQARKVAIKWLELAASKAKTAIANGCEPECMLDEWVKELAAPGYKGRKDFSDREMAMVVFSFLFASQDAMSSGLIYGFQHLADHPDILAKIREEQYRVRAGDVDKPITLEMLDEMPYLKAFVKESMRVKPPVTMVPYKTTKAFPIAADYTVPANSMVIPSFYNSLHDPAVFPEHDKLLPERWLDPNSSANTNPKNYMVFGTGPHKCVGIEYATMNIGLVLANASVLMNWEHQLTPESDKVQIIATLFPKDGCLLKFTPRPRP